MKKAYLLLILILAFYSVSPINAQEEDASPTASEASDSMDTSSNSEPSQGDLKSEADEEPPTPEPPYPDTPLQNKKLKANANTKIQTETPILKSLESPKLIDEDGTYVFNTENQDSDERDVSKLDSTKIPESAKQAPLTILKPAEIRTNGEYFYGFESSPHNRNASLKFGYFAAPKIRNPITNQRFADLYTNSPIPTVFFDYEFQINGRYGELGIKVGTGVFYSTGHGTFTNTSDSERSSTYIPPETFTFVMLPNSLTLQYYFRYSDKQIFIPYAGGGAGYYTFMESRDDSKAPKFGGAGVGIGRAGLQILLDGLDRDAVHNLDSDYGISHLLLNVEYSEIVGINSTYDFSSSVINAGISLDF